MNTVGRLLVLLGLVFFGATAVLRLMIEPEDWANLFGHRSAGSVLMLIGMVLIVVGAVLLIRPKRRTLLIGLALLPLVAYIPGYFWLGEAEVYSRDGRTGAMMRRYSYEWQVVIYRPAGRLESWVRGFEVHIGHDVMYMYPK